MKISNYNKYNIFALKRKKPNLSFFLFLIFFLMGVSMSFCFLKYPSVIKMNGVYKEEKKEYSLIFSMPIELLEIIKRNQTIEINNELYKIEKTEFKETEFSITTNQLFQTVKIIIPKQDYQNNQLVEFMIKEDEKNLWTLLWKSMKGGD